ncbi:aldo/keto reductase [Tengunoibacter tsumagoiensis]|uniref:Oxidoreductase n=1 Tax=Tengunoibacter tsumagoiensis TaxID=2014871 RepID=A0A401ZY48_9CHLR|nr:aldo/keto reductase [Tengunoibacter tsumagoiensis]GCE11760.1 oxidoreductase [Tengunoibacter tsumagoiensis]
MSQKLSWGIIGTGGIARAFAKGLANSKTGQLIAIGSRSQESAESFGESWQVPRRYGSYEQLLADNEVQAVYISTPHPEHAEWAIKAAEAGKHILCEKPLSLNAYYGMAIVEAAQRNNVFLMEAFMYRCHPQIARLVELVQAGAIGEVRVIEASFAFQAGFNPESRLFSNELGGGGILDVGCYCTSLARLVAGAATGKPFAEPTKVRATGYVGKSNVDEYTTASLSFPGNIVAQLLTGVSVNADNTVCIYGSEGSIFLPNPWVPSGETKIIVRHKGVAQAEEIIIPDAGDLYGLEADTVARYLAEKQSPTMSWEDTLGNLRTLDQWRSAIGVSYVAEDPHGPTSKLPLHKRPLAARSGHHMKYGQIAGVEKPVSRLVMGADNQVTWPHASVMFDDFFEQGGNCIDSAYIYGDGICEKNIGYWVKNRGIREQVVILDKGAHTPHCDPDSINRQLLISLDRLQMDYIDIYMLHRDNVEIPVGEFITVLNEHKNAGRIRAFGASNWSIERVQEANAWAAERGLTGFGAMSNNFSLARMVDPVWSGCIAASDPQSRAWLKETQMPIMPWSSQARGFFTGRARPDDHSDPELVRCWYSDDNFQRLERVNQLARERGVLPISIALAYVLNQPFPTFPLIGPRQLSETRTSLPGLDIELTPDEVRWLNLELDTL